MKMVKKLLLLFLMLVISSFTLFPFYIMVNMGTYETAELFKGIAIKPGGYLVDNIITVLRSSFLSFYKNSILISVSITLLSLLISYISGYVFAKYSFKFKKLLYNLVLTMMMIPMQLGLIALAWEVRVLHLNNQYTALILPSIANSYAVFWMTQYIKANVPNEVIESARIDGCVEMSVMFKIVVHFVKPAIVSVGLLLFLWSWNSYITPLVLITNIKLYTLPLGISVLSQLYFTDYAAQIVALSAGTIPVIILFIILSKYFVSGLTSVAVKG